MQHRQTNKIPVSVVILTLNEEVNIANCIQSASEFDEVVVFDSNSADRTREIAEEMGARVLTRPFDNYSSQRNAALNSDLKHEWIFMIDADEEFTPELVSEIRDFLRSENQKDISLVRVRGKNYFQGRWIKRSSGYPTWYSRLFRKSLVRFERDINEECKSSGGKVLHMQGHLLHFPFRKGLHYWFERHNRYSTMEAIRLFEERKTFKISIRGIFSKDPVIRRKNQKQVLYRLPFHFIFVFFYLYIVRGGFWDGVPGFHYSLMRTSYEIMIYSKLNSEEEIEVR